MTMYRPLTSPLLPASTRSDRALATKAEMPPPAAHAVRRPGGGDGRALVTCDCESQVGAAARPSRTPVVATPTRFGARRVRWDAGDGEVVRRGETLTKSTISSFTKVLHECRDGDSDAVGRLFTCVYSVLHGLARRQLSGQAGGHTWQPTVLVHEAFLRLSGREELDWNDRAHFLRAAASAMRCALIDHARERQRLKRSKPGNELPIDSVEIAYESRSMDLQDLNAALIRLEEAEPELAQLVELRFFAGCSVDESARILGTSRRKGERDWAFARRWLFRELSVS